MKTLGLLGGMSWESSALYYTHLNRAIRTRLGGTHSCKLIMHSFDFAEIEALQESGSWNVLANVLTDAAVGLCNAGANAIVLCTNTMHKVANEVETKSGLPLLHIADLTGKKIVHAGCSTVGLLATRYTMEEEFYKGRLTKSFGLEVLVPTELERAVVHDVIYQELVQGIVSSESRRKYVGIIQSLVDRGAQCIILGCTEITLLVREADSQVPIFDTTALHCEGAVDWLLEHSG